MWSVSAGKEETESERKGRGAPLHLADDLASQVAQAKDLKEAKAAAKEPSAVV